jgi:3',5'-cyclic AMP phosphodiesterase CpdA
MRIGLISDVHLGPSASFAGKLRKLGHRARSLTQEFVNLMNREERPELVVNLGDVIEDQDPEHDLEHYREFLAEMANLECEVLHVAGNHDLVNISPTELTCAWGREDGLYYSHDRGGYHFVVLSARQGKTKIEFPREQLEWLERDLGATKLSTVILLHHILGEMDLRQNPWFEADPDICLISGRARVREVLERSGRVVAVFSGHAHWNHVCVIGNIPSVTLQSLTENIDDDAPGRPARAAAVVELTSGRILVRVLGEHPARHEFWRSS